MAAVLLGVGLAASAAPAAEPPTCPLDLDVGLSASSLDGPYSAWFEGRLGLRKDWGERRIAYGFATAARRFNSTDHELALGGSHPLGSRVRAGIEASASPSERFLPSWSAMGEVQGRLGGGLVLGASYRHRDYGGRGVEIGSATLERYSGKLRLAYTFWLNHLEGAGSRASHSVQANRYYEDASSVGLILATGEGLESLEAQRIVETETLEAVLLGSHWVSAEWAVTYAAGYHQQKPFYRRLELQLGIRRRF